MSAPLLSRSAVAIQTPIRCPNRRANTPFGGRIVTSSGQASSPTAHSRWHGTHDGVRNATDTATHGTAGHFHLCQSWDCPPGVSRRHIGCISYEPLSAHNQGTHGPPARDREWGRTGGGHVGAGAGSPSGLLATFSKKSIVELTKSGSTGPACDTPRRSGLSAGCGMWGRLSFTDARIWHLANLRRDRMKPHQRFQAANAERLSGLTCGLDAAAPSATVHRFT